jgi:hypothetical protein
MIAINTKSVIVLLVSVTRTCSSLCKTWSDLVMIKKTVSWILDFCNMMLHHWGSYSWHFRGCTAFIFKGSKSKVMDIKSLKKKVKHSFQASGTTQQTKQRYIPEDCNIHLHYCEKLKNCKNVPLILCCLQSAFATGSKFCVR